MDDNNKYKLEKGNINNNKDNNPIKNESFSNDNFDDIKELLIGNSNINVVLVIIIIKYL